MNIRSSGQEIAIKVPVLPIPTTGLELPGIVDEVITMAELKGEDGTPYRAFVCHTLNPFG